MRVIAVLPTSPLSTGDGPRSRNAHLLDAWTALGDLDVVVTETLTAVQQLALADRWPGGRVLALPEAAPRHRWGGVRGLTHRELPAALGVIDPQPVRRQLRRFVLEAPEPYTAWMAGGASSAWLVRPVVPVRATFIDFASSTADEYDHLVKAARAAPDAASLRGRARWLRLADERDRWFRFELRQGAMVHLVTISSMRDREVIGVPGAVVVPNADSEAAWDPIEQEYEQRVRNALAAAGTYRPKGRL